MAKLGTRLRLAVNLILISLWIAKLSITNIYYFQYAFYKHFPSKKVWLKKNPMGPYRDVEWKPPASREAPQEGYDNRPNIVIILADDLGANDLYGDMFPVTESIRSIAYTGVNFTNAYAGHATCAPSRASLLTGRFPTRFGFEFTPIHPTMSRIFGWTRPGSDPAIHAESVYHGELKAQVPLMPAMSVSLDEKFLPQLLKEHGYHTVHIGKWHLGEYDGYRPTERGFDESLGFYMGASQFLSESNASVGVTARIPSSMMDEFLWRQLPFAVVHNDKGGFFEPNEYMTDYLSKAAVNAIKASAAGAGGCNNDNNKQQQQQCDKKDRVPFYLQVWFNAPHNPLHALKEDYEAPELSHITSHRLRTYAAMIRGLDRGVQRILDGIEAIGETNNTIVIFTSDNGGAEYLGLRDINKPFRGWKATFFDGGLRVPMFMKWPARIQTPGLQLHSPVGHVDLFPTLAGNSVAGIPSRYYDLGRVDGADLMPLIDVSVANDSLITSERDCPNKYDVTSSNKKVLYWRSGHYVAMRVCDWKIQLAERPHKLWLYDLSVDPTEQVNLAEKIPLDDAVRWAKNGCYPTNPQHVFPNLSFEGLITELLQTMCDVLQLLQRTEEAQIPSSWPALVDIVMPIDHPINIDGMEGCGECTVRKDEEHILWPI